MHYAWRELIKCSKSEILKCLFLLFSFLPIGAYAGQNSVMTSLGYNPDTRFDTAAKISSTQFVFALSPEIALNLDYKMLNADSQTTQSYGLALSLGSVSDFMVRLSHELSEKNSYLPSDRTRMLFIRRLKGTRVAGFYELMNAYYGFANNRSFDMSVGHVYQKEWLRVGVATEHWSGEVPQAKILFALNKRWERQRKYFSAKIYLGNLQRVRQEKLLDMEKGLHVIINGDSPLNYFSKNLNLVYRYNAILLDSSFDTGISLGVKFSY